MAVSAFSGSTPHLQCSWIYLRLNFTFRPLCRTPYHSHSICFYEGVLIVLLYKQAGNRVRDQETPAPLYLRAMSANTLPSPPPGGDQNRGNSVLLTNSVFIAIATALVIARLFARIVIVKSVGLDDVFIVLGEVSRHFFRIIGTIIRGYQNASHCSTHNYFLWHVYKIVGILVSVTHFRGQCTLQDRSLLPHGFHNCNYCVASS